MDTKGDPFSSMFGDFFDGFLKGGGGGISFVKPIVVKKCETKEELAAWFTNFARNCRAILPPDKQV